MKIRPVGTELLHPDGQKHMKTLIVAFHNSANSPKNPWLSFSIRFKQIYVFVCFQRNASPEYDFKCRCKQGVCVCACVYVCICIYVSYGTKVPSLTQVTNTF